MRIVVVGAAGGTGSNVVDQALAAGHDVVAVVRSPRSVPPEDRVRVVAADVMDLDAVTAAVSGGDAVICTVGPANNRKPGTVISTGVQNLIAGCRSNGVNRFVFESGLMVGDGRELSALGRLAIRTYGTVNYRLRADKRVAEAAIVASQLDWVIVRPPTLNHAPASDDYQAGPAAPVSPAKSLSHADCAAVLVKAATDSAWVRHVVNVGHR